MSRNFAVLGKSVSAFPASDGQRDDRMEQVARDPAIPIPVYTELIQRLFHGRSVVAVVGDSADHACEGIAAELAASGRRVVVVAAQRLTHSGSSALAGEPALTPGSPHNIWRWPSPLNRHIDFFGSSPAVELDAAGWLDDLRRNFDSVLLNCDLRDSELEIAAMADAAVLVVEAGRTTKQQVQRDQRAIQSKNVKLAGSILVQNVLVQKR
jgi:hypothetical protein